MSIMSKIGIYSVYGNVPTKILYTKVLMLKALHSVGGAFR